MAYLEPILDIRLGSKYAFDQYGSALLSLPNLTKAPLKNCQMWSIMKSGQFVTEVYISPNLKVISF